MIDSENVTELKYYRFTVLTKTTKVYEQLFDKYDNFVLTDRVPASSTASSMVTAPYASHRHRLKLCTG